MKKLFTLLTAFCCSVMCHAQFDVSTEVVCPPGIFTFANGGFSSDSSYVDGNPNNVEPMFIMKLEQGNITTINQQLLYLTSSSRFLTADELISENAPAGSFWQQGIGIEQPVSSGQYIHVTTIEPYDTTFTLADTFYSVNMMLDMDYYDQDSIVLIGPPFQAYDPCHVYGIFIWFRGYLDPPNLDVVLPDDNTLNDIAVMPVTYDCFAKPGGNGTGALSVYRQDVALNIYPNPANDQLNIHQFFQRNAKVTATVTDLSGRVVLKKELGKLQGDQNISIDISALPGGVYMLDVSSIYVKGKGKFVKSAK